MNLYAISHVSMYPYETSSGPEIEWITYSPEISKLPVIFLKGSKGHAFNSATLHQREAYLEESLFWPEGFFALEDLFLGDGNKVECGLINEQIAMFRINPIAPACGTSYPTYSNIAKALPSDLHYFLKYPDTNFRLVTESFVERVNMLGLKNMRFVLRWDGTRSYPILPDQSIAGYSKSYATRKRT